MDVDRDEMNFLRMLEQSFFSESALRPLHELNESLLRLLIEAARRPEPETTPGLPTTLRKQLATLDAPAIGRLASCHISLVDLGFMDRDRWNAIARHQDPPPSGDGGLPRLPAIHLAHATLTLAWTLLQSSKESASVVFGMTPSIAVVVASLGVQTIQDVAERYPHWVRPRWASRPGIWSNLLRMAQEPTQTRNSSLSLYLLQHQFADLLPQTSTNRATRANR
jgi:hypothetical protein